MSKPSKTAHEPQCRKCGATDIEFTYTEDNKGGEIDEQAILASACYYLGEYVGHFATDESGLDAYTLAVISRTLSDLATMLKVREGKDGKSEEATPEMPS